VSKKSFLDGDGTNDFLSIINHFSVSYLKITEDNAERLVDTLRECFLMGDEMNALDKLDDISKSLDRVARAIIPTSAVGCNRGDVHIESLTEAVIHVGDGMHAIAAAIDRIADQNARSRT